LTSLSVRCFENTTTLPDINHTGRYCGCICSAEIACLRGSLERQVSPNAGNAKQGAGERSDLRSAASWGGGKKANRHSSRWHLRAHSLQMGKYSPNILNRRGTLLSVHRENQPLSRPQKNPILNIF